MGLGIAEFVICIEEEFQIDILENDSLKIDTLNDLVDYPECETAKAPHSKEEASRVYRAVDGRSYSMKRFEISSADRARSNKRNSSNSPRNERLSGTSGFQGPLPSIASPIRTRQGSRKVEQPIERPSR